MLDKRFWSKVNITPIGGCWTWKAGKKNGYGRFWLGGSKHLAHRLVWEDLNGPIPEDKRILHTCDNPSCVKPSHLFLGTPKKNASDMVAKDRQAKGELNGASKLTEDDVRAIRSRYTRGESVLSIARDFTASYVAVNNVVRGKTWKHVA